MQRTSPISDPTLKFFMWEPLLLKNRGEGASHVKNLGGPHSFFMWVFPYVLFQGGHGLVRLQVVHGTVRAVMVSVPTVSLFCAFQYTLREWHCSSSGCGSRIRSRFPENSSNGSGFRLRFGSWAILQTPSFYVHKAVF